MMHKLWFTFVLTVAGIAYLSTISALLGNFANFIVTDDDKVLFAFLAPALLLFLGAHICWLIQKG